MFVSSPNRSIPLDVVIERRVDVVIERRVDVVIERRVDVVIERRATSISLPGATQTQLGCFCLSRFFFVAGFVIFKDAFPFTPNGLGEHLKGDCDATGFFLAGFRSFELVSRARWGVGNRYYRWWSNVNACSATNASVFRVCDCGSGYGWFS
jgi:hypothetical protein